MPSDASLTEPGSILHEYDYIRSTNRIAKLKEAILCRNTLRVRLYQKTVDTNDSMFDAAESQYSMSTIISEART